MKVRKTLIIIIISKQLSWLGQLLAVICMQAHQQQCQGQINVDSTAEKRNNGEPTSLLYSGTAPPVSSEVIVHIPEPLSPTFSETDVQLPTKKIILKPTAKQEPKVFLTKM